MANAKQICYRLERPANINLINLKISKEKHSANKKINFLALFSLAEEEKREIFLGSRSELENSI